MKSNTTDVAAKVITSPKHYKLLNITKKLLHVKFEQF